MALQTNKLKVFILSTKMFIFEQIVIKTTYDHVAKISIVTKLRIIKISFNAEFV